MFTRGTEQERQANLDGVVEVAGPQQFRFDELIKLGLSASHDPREVVADPHARYFGAALNDRSLTPGLRSWTATTATPVPMTARMIRSRGIR